MGRGFYGYCGFSQSDHRIMFVNFISAKLLVAARIVAQVDLFTAEKLFHQLRRLLAIRTQTQYVKSCYFNIHGIKVQRSY